MRANEAPDRMRGRHRAAQPAGEAGQIVCVAGNKRRRLVGEKFVVDERQRRALLRRSLARAGERAAALREVDGERVDRVPARRSGESCGQEALAQWRGQDRDLRIGHIVDRHVNVGAAPLRAATAVDPRRPDPDLRPRLR